MPAPPDDHKPRRADPRYPAELRVDVTFREWAHVQRMVTLNASRNGLFLRGAAALPLGAALTLDVLLPDEHRLALRAVVVHVTTPDEAARTGRPAGCGVKLDATHAPDLLLLEAMAEAAGHAAPAPPAAAPVKEAATPAPGTPVPAHVDRPPVVIARIQTVRASELPEPPFPACGGGPVFGIDYGTTFSSIACVQGGRAFVIADEAGRLLVPSIVSYPPNGGVLVGWEARERVATDPGHTVHSAKRVLGRRADELEVSNHLAQQAYPSSKTPGGQAVLDIGGTAYSIPQVVAEVLRLLKRVGESGTGLAVEDVVLAVPVTWGAEQRLALRRAAELAGLRAVALVEEPASAGVAYGYGRDKNEIVAVYDFSGGTFDFNVMDISRDSLRLLVSSGDSWLGGDDFDLALAQDVANQFWKEHKVELQKRVVEWQRLVWACEQAKRALSGEERAVVDVPSIWRSAAGPIHLHSEVSRKRFEYLCAGLLERAMDCVTRSLRSVNLEPGDVGQVIMTGGCTRIPVVRDTVSRFFGRPLETVVNPDEAVALGAAVQGALLSGAA